MSTYKFNCQEACQSRSRLPGTNMAFRSLLKQSFRERGPLGRRLDIHQFDRRYEKCLVLGEGVLGIKLPSSSCVG